MRKEKKKMKKKKLLTKREIEHIVKEAMRFFDEPGIELAAYGMEIFFNGERVEAITDPDHEPWISWDWYMGISPLIIAYVTDKDFYYDDYVEDADPNYIIKIVWKEPCEYFEYLKEDFFEIFTKRGLIVKRDSIGTVRIYE